MKKVLLIAVALMMMASMASADWAVEVLGNTQGFKLIQSDMMGATYGIEATPIMPGQVGTVIEGNFGEYWFETQADFPGIIYFKMWTLTGFPGPSTYTLSVADFGAEVGADLPHGGNPTFKIWVVNDPLGVLSTNHVIGSGTFVEGEANLFNFSFPYAGWVIGSELTLAYEVIPEPGTMVALGSGLVGLVGFAIRRRK